jgi:hypothetical protein
VKNSAEVVAAAEASRATGGPSRLRRTSATAPRRGVFRTARGRAALLTVVGLAVGWPVSSFSGSAITRESTDTISFPARVQSDQFEPRLLGMPGYHLLVSQRGNAASAALLVTAVTDAEVLDALEALGARPGDGLDMDSWDERKDPASPAADKQIVGPPVDVFVRVPGRAALLRLDEILEDPAGRGFEMRLGGHRANIPHWHSGCVICLYSCPGSKIGNARYTVRDYVRDTTAFRVRPGVLPPDGSTVEIVLRLLPRPPASAVVPPPSAN